jgi:hypothetical protein
MMKAAEVAGIEAKIHERRRPKRDLVRSENRPIRGSEIASQMREIPYRSPITPGAMSSTSVLYLKRYSEFTKAMAVIPIDADPKATMRPRGSVEPGEARVGSGACGDSLTSMSLEEGQGAHHATETV